MKYKDRFLKKIFLVALVAIIALPMGIEGLGNINPANPVGSVMENLRDDDPSKTATNDNVPILSKKRETHILYGDTSGGGHLYGTRKPCKSEFPKEWSAGNIIHAVKSIASNDNTQWRIENNGYQTAEKMIGTIRVRVVLDDDRSHIITAYPTNTRRNACPRHANDN